MAESVGTAEYISIFERIHSTCSYKEKACSAVTCKPLFGFLAGECNEQPHGIPYALLDYLELVDWTIRVIRDDKRGAISEQIPSPLNTLGSLEELALFAAHTGKRWIAGKQNYGACSINSLY